MRILVLNSEDDARRIYGDALLESGLTVEYRGEASPSPEAVLDSAHPDLVLLSLEWLPHHRLVSAEAARRDIPTLYVMDGVLEWSYVWNNQSYISPSGTMAQPLIAGHIAAIGRHPARVLASLGLRDRTHVVGLPRLDGFPRTRTIRPHESPTVLVACARTPSHNLEHEANVTRALSDLKAAMEEIGLRATWRIPGRLASEIGVAPSHAPLVESLDQVDALVTFPSTLALEGMLKGLPTAIVEYRPVPVYLDSAWQIRSKEHIYPVLNELLYPPAEKKAYQDHCLGEELEAGEAGARLRSLIHAVAQREFATAAAGPVPGHGALDFKLVHSQISSFSASPVAAMQYEIEAHRAYRKFLHERIAELLGTWQVRLARRLRMVPAFKNVNRILDFFSGNRT